MEGYPNSCTKPREEKQAAFFSRNRNKHLLLAVILSFLTYIIFYGQFLTPSHYFWSNNGEYTDAQTKHAPARAYLYDKIVNEHSFPFWTEKMYSGFPIYADPENAYLHPINIASVLVFGPQSSYKVLHLLEYLIGSLSLYFLLRRKGIGLLGFAAANAIFYFNTFLINQQIYFNMVMALFLIPTSLLLVDLFIEKRRPLLIVLESLVIANAILWGHMQSAVIISMGVFAYMVVFSFRRMSLSRFLFYFLALIFLVVLITLPQVLPTYQLFSQSVRSSSLNYLKGSFNPRVAIFSFVPYLLGGYKDFLGRQMSVEISYVKIYTYFGISSAILSALSLLLLKKSREVISAFVFIWIFLIFGFMAYNNIFPDNTPIITLFREWERTAALSSFGIALLVGIFVEKISEVSLKNIRTGIWFVLSPLIYILILTKMDDGKIAHKLSPYISYQYIQSYPYFPALKTIVLVLVGVLLLFFIAKKWYPNVSSEISFPVKVILVGIVLFDLVYFNQDALALNLQDISNYKPASIPQELENRRTLISSSEILGNESLYYGNWSPLGQSQLKESEYANYYNRLGVNLNGVPSSQADRTINYQNLNYQGLKEAGVVAVVNGDGITYLNDSQLDLIKNNLSGHYVKKEEGRIVMQINNPEDTTINTYLKYSPYWKVKVDGRGTEIAEDGLFFDFPLGKGDHLVEIRYFPKPFYVALAFSLILGIITALLFYARRKNIKKWLSANV
jgi:hypothetical protein